MLVAIFVVSGCSLMLERSAKYSEYSLENGHSRDEIISEIGEPIKTNVIENDCSCDVYLVSGRVYDSGDHWAASAGWVMTLGLHELVFFPMTVWEVITEAISPSEKELEICGPYGNDGTWHLTEIRGQGYLCDQNTI